MQCKGAKASKLTFGQFKMALRIIAEYLNWDVAAVHTRIAQSDGPLVNNITLPRYVKQHDTHPTGHSPTASQRAAMTQSFLGGGSTSMMYATPKRGASGTPKGLTPKGVTPRSSTPRGGSQKGGATMTPGSSVRQSRDFGSDTFTRRSSTAPVGAWR